MKALIVYDSTWGNTELIAGAVAAGLEPAGEVKVARADAVTATDLEAVDLLVVGAPVQGGRPTNPVQDFLGRLRELRRGTRAAAFDTRLGMRWVGIFGFAAPRIADALQAKGGTLAAGPEGFIVMGKQGPLKDGEIERATAWGGRLAGGK